MSNCKFLDNKCIYYKENNNKTSLLKEYLSKNKKIQEDIKLMKNNNDVYIDSPMFESKSIFKKSDTEVFEDIENNIKLISEKLKICFDENCTNSRCKNIFMTYSSKKVGSTALWGSINLFLSDFYSTLHIHAEEDLERLEIYELTMNQIIQIFKKYKKNVIVVDIYRPILDTMISQFFDNLSIEFHASRNLVNLAFNSDELIERFNQIFYLYYSKNDCDYFCETYNIEDNNIKEKFDFEKKHIYFKDETIHYFKLRLCDADEWEKILKPYLIGDFQLIKSNESDKKIFSELYKSFKSKYELPKNYVESIKENQYLKKYYSQLEYDNYIDKIKISNDDFQMFNKATLSSNIYFKNKNKSNLIYGLEILIQNKPIAQNCICNECKKLRNKTKLSIKEGKSKNNTKNNLYVKSNLNNNKGNFFTKMSFN